MKIKCPKCGAPGPIHVDVETADEIASAYSFKCEPCDETTEIPPERLRKRFKDDAIRRSTPQAVPAPKPTTAPRPKLAQAVLAPASPAIVQESPTEDWPRPAAETRPSAPARMAPDCVGPDGTAGVVAPDRILGRLDELGQILDGLAARPDPAEVIEAHRQLLAGVEADMSGLLDPGTVSASLETIRAEVARLADEAAKAADRPAAEIDPGAIGGAILAQLAESRRAGALRAGEPEPDPTDRHDDLAQILRGLPRLFDAVEVPLETWEAEEKLDDDQRPARDQVGKVLRQVKRKFDDWRRLQGIDHVPDDRDGPQPYDTFWHVREKVEPTDDPSLHGKVARVIESGYSREGERLRKAKVAVRGPPEAPGP